MEYSQVQNPALITFRWSLGDFRKHVLHIDPMISKYVPGGFPPVSGGACRIPVWGFWILCNHKEIITYHLIINFFVRLICEGDPRRPPSALHFSKNQNVLEGPNVLHTQFIYLFCSWSHANITNISLTRAITGIGGGSIATEHSKCIMCTTDFLGPIQIKVEQAPSIIPNLSLHFWCM